MAFQVRLCIPQETVDAAHTEICGQLFEKVILDLAFVPYLVAKLMACSMLVFLHLFGHYRLSRKPLHPLMDMMLIDERLLGRQHKV